MYSESSGDVLNLVSPELLTLLGEFSALSAELTEYVEVNNLPFNLVRRRGVLINKLHFLDAADAHSNVFARIPLLTPEACRIIREHFELEQYSVNAEEAELYQMREVVLKEHDLELHAILAALWRLVVVPIVHVMHGYKPSVINSIQLAKYLPDAEASTGWHFDADSNCTLVVELTEEPDLTGVELILYPNTVLNPARTGVATLFNGQTVMHKTTPTKTVRDILVFWAENEY